MFLSRVRSGLRRAWHEPRQTIMTWAADSTLLSEYVSWIKVSTALGGGIGLMRVALFNQGQFVWTKEKLTLNSDGPFKFEMGDKTYPIAGRGLYPILTAGVMGLVVGVGAPIVVPACLWQLGGGLIPTPTVQTGTSKDSEGRTLEHWEKSYHGVNGGITITFHSKDEHGKKE